MIFQYPIDFIIKLVLWNNVGCQQVQKIFPYILGIPPQTISMVVDLHAYIHHCQMPEKRSSEGAQRGLPYYSII